MASGNPGKALPVRTLFILRHGNAANSPDGVDFNRPLAPAGVLEAQTVGRFIRQQRIPVEAIVTSAALRALQTAEQVAQAAGLAARPQAEPALYNAPGESLLDWVQHCGLPAPSLLLVGHMPGVGDLCSLLICRSAEVALSFQPATLACVIFEGYGWDALSFGQGLLKWLLPVDLLPAQK